MRCLLLAITLLTPFSGCSQILGLHDVTHEHRVGGQVRGLWDGSDGVTLQLRADGVDTLLTVLANGTFSFADQLAPGASYSVAVVANPLQHTCSVDAGGNGVIANDDMMAISIACAGPAVVALSGEWGWVFDPTQDSQRFKGSVIVQTVALIIGGSNISGASINGTIVPLNEQTAPIALPLGEMSVSISVSANGGLSKTYECVFDRGGEVLDQIVYGKASNAQRTDVFGYSVALSGDTLAVGAHGESSAAKGINGNQADNSVSGAGAVYVFVRNGTTWAQQAYVKASNPDMYDSFGSSVALFNDTLAVGAYAESSAATGINGSQLDNTASNAGAVYVFVRSGTAWTQQAYIKASNSGALDNFGRAIALFDDTLAVGAPSESSAVTGINGNQADNTSSNAGAVYVFVRSGTTWTQQAYIKASNTGIGDLFGDSVALFSNTLVIGAPEEASAATGVNGNQADNTAGGAGAVYVFVRSVTTWTQQAYLKASNAGAGDEFGCSVALSGNTLVVGASGEASGATGINGNEADNSVFHAGAAYVFERNNATWTQQAYVKAANTSDSAAFGISVALSGDTLAVGAYTESITVTPESNSSHPFVGFAGAGAAYLFGRVGTTWTQRSYVKASNAGAADDFGTSVALTGDTLVIGAPFEASATTGINGNQADNSATAAGAIYIYR